MAISGSMITLVFHFPSHQHKKEIMFLITLLKQFSKRT